MLDNNRLEMALRIFREIQYLPLPVQEADFWRRSSLVHWLFSPPVHMTTNVKVVKPPCQDQGYPETKPSPLFPPIFGQVTRGSLAAQFYLYVPKGQVPRCICKDALCLPNSASGTSQLGRTVTYVTWPMRLYSTSPRLSEITIFDVFKGGIQESTHVHVRRNSEPAKRQPHSFTSRRTPSPAGHYTIASASAPCGWPHVSLSTVTSRAKWWGCRRHLASKRTLSLSPTSRRHTHTHTHKATSWPVLVYH